MSYSMGFMSIADQVYQAAAEEQLRKEREAITGKKEPGTFDKLGGIMKMALILAAVVVVGVPLSRAMKG